MVGQHYKAGVQILTARYTNSAWTTFKLITAVAFIHFTNNTQLSLSPRVWPASASITRRIIAHPHKPPLKNGQTGIYLVRNGMIWHGTTWSMMGQCNAQRTASSHFSISRTVWSYATMCDKPRPSCIESCSNAELCEAIPDYMSFGCVMHDPIVESKPQIIPLVEMKTKRHGQNKESRPLLWVSIGTNTSEYAVGYTSSHSTPRSLKTLPVSGTADIHFTWHLQFMLACRGYSHGVPSAARAHELVGVSTWNHSEQAAIYEVKRFQRGELSSAASMSQATIQYITTRADVYTPFTWVAVILQCYAVRLLMVLRCLKS